MPLHPVVCVDSSVNEILRSGTTVTIGNHGSSTWPLGRHRLLCQKNDALERLSTTIDHYQPQMWRVSKRQRSQLLVFSHQPSTAGNYINDQAVMFGDPMRLMVHDQDWVIGMTKNMKWPAKNRAISIWQSRYLWVMIVRSWCRLLFDPARSHPKKQQEPVTNIIVIRENGHHQ